MLKVEFIFKIGTFEDYYLRKLQYNNYNLSKMQFYDTLIYVKMI